jgi:dihydrofolate reductase
MRKLLATTFMTLDGVMQAPGGPEEDPDGGFAYGGWGMTQWDDAMGDAIGRIMGKPFDLLLGHRTYEIFAGYWPQHADQPGAQPLNDATKYVVSHGRPELPWGPSQLISGDVPAAIATLKAGDGPELQVHGSGNLLQTLLRNGLIDELHVWIFPVLVGSGKRLFADGTVPAGLRLVDSLVSSSGVFIGTYVPAGAVPIGSPPRA